jgi:hypothetical protein
MAGVVGAVIGGAAIIGGIAGSQKSRTSGESYNESGINLAEESALEKKATAGLGQDYDSLKGMVETGPGQGDVIDSTRSTREYASMLEEARKTGGMPGEQDWQQGRQLASQQFDPQRTALNQQFDDQTVEASRLAAKLGRSPNDPIIQNKLRQERMRQMSMLSSQENASAGQFAMNQPLQRLNFAAQLADTRGNLASQALSNRQALLSMGHTLQQSERNWRLQTGTRWQSGKYSQESGGGIKGAIEGAIGGAGAGMNLMAGFSGFGAGGAASKPMGAVQGIQQATGGNMLNMNGPSGSNLNDYNMGGNGNPFLNANKSLPRRNFTGIA